MKLNVILAKTIQFFKDKNFETPRLDAELLIAHALKMPRIQLYVKHDVPLSEAEINLCRDYVRRRAQGEPVAYITEEKGFYGLNFKVQAGVLIPRPETELIVEHVLDDHKKNPCSEVRILDLGAGSGCIGLTLVKNIPQARLISVEKSVSAYHVLCANAESLQVIDRCELLNIDVEDYSSDFGPFDYIVSNPPYISADDSQVEVFVKKFEPSEALFSPDQGLYALKTWSKKFSSLVKPQGLMLFEMGHLQGLEMQKHFENLNAFADVTIIKDLSGLDRIIKARAY